MDRKICLAVMKRRKQSNRSRSRII